MTWRFALCIAIVLSTAFGSRATAQTAPDPPTVIAPLKIAQDLNHVNLTTGARQQRQC